MIRKILKAVTAAGVCVGTAWAGMHALAEYLRQNQEARSGQFHSTAEDSRAQTAEGAARQMALAERRVREQDLALEAAERALHDAIDLLEGHVAERRKAQAALAAFSEASPSAPSVPISPSAVADPLPGLSLPNFEHMIAIGNLAKDIERLDAAINQAAGDVHAARMNWRLADARADLARAEWEELVKATTAPYSGKSSS